MFKMLAAIGIPFALVTTLAKPESNAARASVPITKVQRQACAYRISDVDAGPASRPEQNSSV
jgi:hypothetical protein